MTGVEDPLVTFNVLSYNRLNDLRVTLGNIYAQEYRNIEVIVVDNGSTDGSAEMVAREFPGAILIRRRHNIGIAGWNDGFRIAKGEYICVLDDDCHIEGQTIRSSIERFCSDEADIISYNVVDPGTGYSYTLYFPGGIFSFWGCAFMMKRKVLDLMSGFDENIFLYHHESEFMLRAMGHGLKHRILLSERAFHRKDPSLQHSNPRKSELQFFSLAYSYLKHLRGRQYIRMLAYYTIEALIYYVRSITKYREWKPITFIALWRALYKAHAAAEKRPGYPGWFIIENDMNCLNPLRRLLLRKRSPQAEREYLCRFMKERIKYYPDFNEEYFLCRKPFNPIPQ